MASFLDYMSVFIVKMTKKRGNDCALQRMYERGIARKNSV